MERRAQAKAKKAAPTRESEAAAEEGGRSRRCEPSMLPERSPRRLKEKLGTSWLDIAYDFEGLWAGSYAGSAAGDVFSAPGCSGRVADGGACVASGQVAHVDTMPAG